MMLEKLINSRWAKHLLNLAGGLFIGGSVLFNPITASAEDAVLTVLCHGIKSNPESMKKIEDAVEDQSAVVNVHYPSTEQRIKNFAYNLDLAIKDKSVQLKGQNIDVNSIVLVGHSMGGLVERYYLESRNPQFEDAASKVKAIVMIATPNHGSFLANVVCYQAALAGNTSDAIPQSIKDLTKPSSQKFKILPWGDAAQKYKNLLNNATGISNMLNFVDSTWGRSSVFELNTAPDGFIENELNKFGLRQGVYYCVVAGTDNTLPTAAFMMDDPLYKFGGDSVVLVKRADIGDLVKDKSNYRFETVKANHLNITENEDAIRIVGEVVSKFRQPYLIEIRKNGQKNVPSRSGRNVIGSPKDVCIDNLRQIGGAVERFAMEKGIRNGGTVTMTQLVNGGYLESTPSCPTCGSYASNQKVGVDPVCPGWARSDVCGKYHVLP